MQLILTRGEDLRVLTEDGLAFYIRAGLDGASVIALSPDEFGRSGKIWEGMGRVGTQRGSRSIPINHRKASPKKPPSHKGKPPVYDPSEEAPPPKKKEKKSPEKPPVKESKRKPVKTVRRVGYYEEGLKKLPTNDRSMAPTLEL